MNCFRYSNLISTFNLNKYILRDSFVILSSTGPKHFNPFNLENYDIAEQFAHVIIIR